MGHCKGAVVTFLPHDQIIIRPRVQIPLHTTSGINDAKIKEGLLSGNSIRFPNFVSSRASRPNLNMKMRKIRPKRGAWWSE